MPHNPFEYNLDLDGNQVNLVTEGSENIDDETDVWLNVMDGKVGGHKKSVSFKDEDDVIDMINGMCMVNSNNS